jgi:hypothetical protein
MGALRTSALAAVAAAALIVFPSASGESRAANPQLFAQVGTADSSEAFVISLRDSGGIDVTNLDPGTYDVQVDDWASFHNFHLIESTSPVAVHLDGERERERERESTSGEKRDSSQARSTHDWAQQRS